MAKKVSIPPPGFEDLNPDEKECQEMYVKLMHQSTRRLGVDTKWLQEFGVRAAKDVLTVEEYHKVRNHLEDKYKNVRLPAPAFAEKVLK